MLTKIYWIYCEITRLICRQPPCTKKKTLFSNKVLKTVIQSKFRITATPSSLPGGRIPKGGGRKGPSLEKIAGARETKASRMEKLKYLLEKKWRQIGLLAEKFPRPNQLKIF